MQRVTRTRVYCVFHGSDKSKKYSFDDLGKLEIKTHGVESSMIGLKNRHGVGIFPSSNQFSRFRVLMIVMTLCQPCSLSHSH